MGLFLKEKEWTWEKRISNYARATGFPKSLFLASDGRVVGTWIMDDDTPETTQLDSTTASEQLK